MKLVLLEKKFNAEMQTSFWIKEKDFNAEAQRRRGAERKKSFGIFSLMFAFRYFLNDKILKNLFFLSAPLRLRASALKSLSFTQNLVCASALKLFWNGSPHDDYS